MRRIERLINLIAALLDAPRPMAIDEIRDVIAGYEQDNPEAFRRTFERDKQTLRTMGIPIETVELDPLDPSRIGYVIPKARYYLPQIDLEPDELAALRIAADAVIGSQGAAAAGLLKLSVEESPQESVGRVVWGADLAAEQPLLGPLYQAWLDRATVKFAYTRPGDEEPSERTVEIYGLAHRRGNWYALGRDMEREAIRAFRVARISGAVEPVGQTYEIPRDFAAGEHLGEAWEIGPGEATVAVVRFDEPVAWWAEHNLPDYPKRPGPQGTTDVEVPVGNLDALVSWVIGFGGAAEIVSPPAGRTRMAEHLAPYLEAPA